MQMECLLQCSANYVPFTPINFLERAAHVYGDKTSIVYGTTVRFSWRETYERCLKIASALLKLQLSRGDIVAALAPNIPALYKLHFAVPMAGAVLSALNTRLDAAMVASILEQLEAKIMFVDYQFVELVLKALNILSQKSVKPPLLVVIPEFDQAAASSTANNLPPGSLVYNDVLEMGNSDHFEMLQPENECDPISVNFTSGSTGHPKGVVYSHRAAYLNSLAQISRCDMKEMPVFLWTVDMFRCNGWCCTWALAALGGTNICLRNVSAKVIFDSIFLHKVTHFCGAPAILNIIANASPSEQQPLQNNVNVVIAGALPTAQILEKVSKLGFNIGHAYGMTEVLGIATVRPWKTEWDSSTLDEHEKIRRREGLHSLFIQGVDVKDPSTMKSVPYDGKTIGEIMFKANSIMLGYLKNPKATQEVFRDGWYHTGDLAVRHPDGYIQIKDRKNDIIISGAATISTLEVEAVLLSNPKVSEAAVVGKPDDQLQQVPCAFVKLKDGCDSNPEELVKFCEGYLPSYMVPRAVVFEDIPVNSTGKVQKFTLREKLSKCRIS
ncbi:hypothetical protein Pint_28632 [Pistacia integerrima]|uniref:Uncharacterized protein n=1 Tax=Pistacia integerrima TaxID=434235 RepID=A0ACC0YT39_9ROSI|nr:hypothetical protein Pint_28632 [Pistacia integerrima]